MTDIDSAALAGRLLEEERRRHESSDEGPIELPDDQLPGVGADSMPLRQVLRRGGASTVLILGFLNLVDEFDRITIAVLGPDIQRTFGLNDTALAALAGAGAVAVLLGALPLGVLADRRRRTTLMGITSLLWAGFAVLGGLVASAWQLGLTRIVNGLGKGNGPVASSLLADRYAIEGRGRVFALHGLANPVGLMIGPLLVAGVAAIAGGTEGWRWALIVLALPAAVLAIAAFRLSEPSRGLNERSALGIGDADLPSDPIPLATGFKHLRKAKTFAALLSALGALGLALTGATVIFNLLLERQYGLDGVGRGVIASVTAFGGLIGFVVGGRVADRLFRQDPARVLRWVAVSMALAGSIYTAGLYLPQAWMLATVHTAAAALISAPFAAMSALVSSIVPYRMRGIAFAVVGIYLVLVGGLIGGVLTGILSDALGERAALTIIMPAAFAGAAGYVRSAARHVRRDISSVVAELREEQAEVKRLRSGRRSKDMVQIRNLDFSYGQVQVLFGVDVSVQQGETLALLGTNGAGKSTLLRVLSGLEVPDRGVVRFDGRTITYTEPRERVRRGIVHVPGGRAVFGGLTVRENLLAGAHTFVWDSERLKRQAGAVLDLFPPLVPLLDQPAATLSGGEQQMLSLAKALLLEPRLLLIDELSLGLAPVAVETILATVERLKATGLTMIVVEQSINVALAVADRAVFMEKGRVRFQGRAADLLERDDLARAVFLGIEG